MPPRNSSTPMSPALLTGDQHRHPGGNGKKLPPSKSRSSSPGQHSSRSTRVTKPASIEVELRFESRPCLLTKPKDFPHQQHNAATTPPVISPRTSVVGDLTPPPPASTTTPHPSVVGVNNNVCVASSSSTQQAHNASAVLPRTFHRCGDYDVFLSEVPPKSMLPALARAVREQVPHAAHITWVLVSTDSTLAMYFGEQPHKARVPDAVWADLKSLCTSAGFFSLGPPKPAAAQSPSTASPGSEHLTTADPTPRRGGKTPRKNSKTPSTTPRGPTVVPFGQPALPAKLPVDDAMLEQLMGSEVITAAGRKGNAMSVVEAIRAGTGLSTPVAPTSNASQLLTASGTTTSSSAISEAQKSQQPPSLIRLFHPADVAVSKPLVESVWHLMSTADEYHAAEYRKAQPATKVPSPTTPAAPSISLSGVTTTAPASTAYVILSVDQMPLAQHIAALMCLYQRTKQDIEGWRSILNATERLRDRNYIYDFDKIEKEIQQGRQRRDDTRKMLREAQLNQLNEAGLTTTATEFVAKWEAMSVWHRERREAEDERRQTLDILQGSGAAVRVQSILRGVMTRRKTNGVVLKKIKKEVKDFEGPYRRGRYPIVDATMEYLQFVLGTTMITAETMKKGQMREAVRWKRTKSRVPPQDVENDVSSEEELWEEETYEKVSSEGTGAINPMHMADVCLAAVKSHDKDILFDAFVNYPGVPAVQERAFRGSMERLVHYILIATYWCAKHRVREGNGTDAGPYASTNLLNMSVKLKNSCDTYDQFTTEFRRPQEWLNHPQFSLLLLTNIPQPLHQSRLLVAAPPASQPSQGRVDGRGRADVFLPNAPIYVVAEGSTTDQWADALSIVQRTSLRCKKILWLSTTPNFCVYVNGAPMYLVERQKGAQYSVKASEFAEIAAPLVSTVMQATNAQTATASAGSGTVLTASEEVLVESAEGMEKQNAKKNANSKSSPFAVQNVAAKSTSPTMTPVTSSLEASQAQMMLGSQLGADAANQSRRRSPSVLALDVPSLNTKGLEASSAILSSRTPHSARRQSMAASSSMATSPQQIMGMSRRKSSVVTDMSVAAAAADANGPTPSQHSHQALRKHEGGWYGIAWETVEQSLVDELVARIDHPKSEGTLTCFSVNNGYNTTTHKSTLAIPMPEVHRRLFEGSRRPIWMDHCVDVVRFQASHVDVLDVRVTQQRSINTAASRASRSSKGSNHVTPRLSMSTMGGGHMMSSSSMSVTPIKNLAYAHQQQQPPTPLVVPRATPEPTSGETSSRRRRGVRRSMSGSRRSSSVGGSSANSHNGEDDGENPIGSGPNAIDGILHAPVMLPVQAKDALRTPCQAVDEVREKLLATSRSECLVNYRKVPMLSPFGDEWLRNLDHILTSFRDHLNDQTASLAIAVSSNDSVWIALFACILWEVDSKHTAPRKPLSTAFNGSLGPAQRSFLNSGPTPGAIPASPTSMTGSHGGLAMDTLADMQPPPKSRCRLRSTVALGQLRDHF
ncbi:Hypothetical protein, putative [Bodo saltans]|uniref:Uncharacterized protein n=1 Tax=Bodo saltans TaxID=75058 RepID=A0A0S4JJY9_BODSA|nr:Hypothetical protein, putative [Bodo saltans]|eukprot:CUG90570.1 Hypothetical protein, putative [Bodo saltans]